MKLFGLVGIFLINTFGAFAMAEADIPELESLQIENITYNGSGCPLGTAGVNLSPDKEAFTITFSEFIATSDYLEDKIKFCNFNFELETPEGFEFGVISMQFRGASYLSEGASATQNASFKINGGRENLGKMKLQGEYDDFYERLATIPIEQVEWRGCKKRQMKLQVNSTIKMKTREGTLQEGYITVDSFDGEASQDYNLVWRKCKRKKKRYQAFCSADLYKNGKLKRQLLAKARGKSEERAEEKARDKIAKKCEKKLSKEGKAPKRCEIRPECLIVEI